MEQIEASCLKLLKVTNSVIYNNGIQKAFVFSLSNTSTATKTKDQIDDKVFLFTALKMAIKLTNKLL